MSVLDEEGSPGRGLGRDYRVNVNHLVSTYTGLKTKLSDLLCIRRVLRTSEPHGASSHVIGTLGPSLDPRQRVFLL